MVKNRRNIIIKAFLAIILSISFILLLTKSDFKLSNVKAEDNNPYITITSANHSEKDNGGVYSFYNDITTNLITLTINAGNLGSGDIKIKYYAEDVTASCAAGDYFLRTSEVTSTSTADEKLAATHELSTIVLNSTKSTATITYSVTQTNYGTKYSTTEIRRYFKFIIAEISGAYIKDGTANDKVYKCFITNKNTISIGKDANGYYMSAYGFNYTKSYDQPEWHGSNNDKTATFNIIPNTTKNSSGESITRDEVVKSVLNSGFGNIYTYMYIHAEARISNWDELVFKVYSDLPNKTDSEDEYIGYWHERWVYNYTEDVEVKTKNSYKKDGKNYAVIDGSWGDTVRVIGHNGCGSYNRWADYHFSSYISDDKSAVVTGSYIDASSMLIDGKIKLIIRFSEPVQATKPSDLAVIGAANGLKDIKFEYEDGNCTDTLCFVTTIKDSGLDKYEKMVSYFTITEIENFTSISDLGRNFRTGKPNYLQKYDYDDILGDYEKAKCSLDLRVPSIASISTNNPTSPTTSRTVDLKITNVSKATLYYTWSTDKNKTFTTVKDYESSMEIVGDTDSEVVKSLTISGVTGEYFLHICIQNIFGKTGTFLYGNSSTQITSSNIATAHGFRLDNSDPLLDSVKLYQDTLSSKVFDLRVGDGTNYCDGGIETIYISIKKGNGDNALRADYPIYSINAATKSLIATDIGIGDRADVYYMDANLKNVNYKTKSDPKYFNGNTEGSLMFSSKTKAYEYFYDNELTDFQTIKLESSNTNKIQDVKDQRAAGETEEPVAGQVWIRYKKANFQYDGTYEESDWVYYYYSGTNEKEIDLAKALQNTRLLEAVKNAADKLTDKGSMKNLYLLNEQIDSTTNLPSLETSKMRRNVEFSQTVYENIKFTTASKITYSDNEMVFSSAGGHFTLKLDKDTSIINCPIGNFVDLYIGFYVEDGAGNTNIDSIEYKKYRYDDRVLFDCDFQTNASKALDDVDEIMVYNTGSKLNLSYTINETEGIIGDLEILEIYCYDKDATNPGVRLLEASEYDKFFTISYIPSGLYKNKIEITPKFSGYAKIEVALNNGGTKKRHDPYEFYFTNSFTDDTKNYSSSLNNRILVNSVYKLNEQYVYMDSAGVIQRESYGNKDSGNVYFSTMDALQEYVRFMELQDLQLVVLTTTMAESLASGGIGTYTKADGETNIPQTGQTWIRYKISTWTNASTQTAWVYYFYSNTSVVSIQDNKLENTLIDTALKTVVNSIVSKAEKVNLVNGSYIDEYGSPTLLSDEVHPNNISVAYTKTKSLFASNIQFSGDKKLFDSTIKINIEGTQTDIPILTNQVLTKENDHTHIYFAYYNGQPLNTLEYRELIYKAGQTYREAINSTNGTNGASGTYIIREVSDSGIHEYQVYIDNLAPTLNIKFTSPTSSVVVQRALNSESNGYQFGCKTFTISTINSNIELDKYAYVIVYDSNYKVTKVLYMKDLETEEYQLSNGSWTIYVNDRSGNSYLFSVSCTTSKLTLEVAVDDSNDYVKVAINREPEEIYRYQVFLNGADTPLDDVWNGTTTSIERYKESGFYYVYVQDIYGYILEMKGEGGTGLVFERSVPSVIWSYLSYDDSSYEPYDAQNTTIMSMYKSLGNVYYISTARPIKIRMTESYCYEITGLDLESEVRIPTAKDILFGNIDSYLKTGELHDFEIKLWYEDYPDITVTYVVTCDTVSPDIFLTYKSTSWDTVDSKEALDLFNSKEVGYVYNPALENPNYKINYYATKDVVCAISNGGIINSNLMTLNIEDESGVKVAYVYLTDDSKKEELLMELTPVEGRIENITLSRYGSYRIVAIDVFGNTDEILFTNTAEDRITYSVDDVTLNQRDKTITYGNDNATINLLEDCQIAIQVIDSTGNYIYFISTLDGVAYLQEYRCRKVASGDYSYNVVELVNKQIQVLNSSGMFVYQDEELFSYEDPVYNTPNKYFKVLSKYDVDGTRINPFNLYVKYDKNYLLSFKVECVDEDIDVTIRAFLGFEVEPYLLESKLSKRASDVKLLDKEENEIEASGTNLINTNATFKVDQNLDPEITKVEISYSDVKDFKNYTTLYPYTKTSETDTNTFGTFDTSKNGFYSIRITNVYGNVNVYTINRSDEFLVIYSANYDDGDYDKLSKEYNGTIKANKSITIEAYSDNVEFIITKNGKTASKTKGKQVDGYYQLTLTEEAIYSVKIVDLVYGNIVNVNATIKYSKLTYDQNLITGYNEKALEKENGYTNQKLSITKQKVEDLKIKYIEIKFNDESNIIYNAVNDESAVLDETLLIDSIGNSGDGVYYVIFKDEYGSKVVKEIHYAFNSPFTISRKISSSQEYVNLEINDESIAFGFWSNDTFVLDTTATTYKFIVNEANDECPKTIAFANEAGNGTIPYQIYYIDEYGFEFSFTATLDKRDLSITLDDSVKTILINEILNTNNQLSLTFSDGNCFYTIDGENETEYFSGDILYKDGAYRFNCFDKAGNSASLVVIKDSTCEFEFIVNGGSKVLIDGEAFNGDYVTLESDDNIKITKYYINGVKQDDLEIERFTKGGHYYIFLEDGIGNTTVFEFVLITHNLNSFTYQTPNTYIITELWFSGKDGTFTNYLATGKVSFYDTYSVINNITEDGDYTVVMTSSTYKKGLSFSFTIDSTCPDVYLTGTDGVHKTIEDVTLEGCKEGDVITIYRDGELYATYEYAYNSEPIKILYGGKYTIIVRNEAGNETVLTFEKIKILANSGSVLVIIACLAFVAGIIIAVCLKNKQKYDE